MTSPMFVLHALHGSNDPNSFVRTLNELMPIYVVLYDADMSSVRQLEVRVYVHIGSVVCNHDVIAPCRSSLYKHIRACLVLKILL